MTVYLLKTRKLEFQNINRPDPAEGVKYQSKIGEANIRKWPKGLASGIRQYQINKGASSKPKQRGLLHAPHFENT